MPFLPFRQHVGFMGNQNGEDTGPTLKETKVRNRVNTEEEEQQFPS